MEKTTARPLPAQTAPVLANSATSRSTAESKASANQQAQTPTAPAVALTIASQSTGQSERPLKSGSTTKDVPATNAAVKAHAVVPTNAGEAPFTSESPTPASALAAASTSSPQTSPSLRRITMQPRLFAPTRSRTSPASSTGLRQRARPWRRPALNSRSITPTSASLPFVSTSTAAASWPSNSPPAIPRHTARLPPQSPTGRFRPRRTAPRARPNRKPSRRHKPAATAAGREGQAGHGASARHEQPAQRRSSAQDGKPSAGDRPPLRPLRLTNTSKPVQGIKRDQ